jgi:predicted tellurium resistance membrane protein TerC
MSTSTVVYIVVMIAIIVGIDLLFLRSKPLERLIVNVGIVVLFLTVYMRFVKKG